jgi:DNA-binding LytR/AlgR family response regulator
MKIRKIQIAGSGGLHKEPVSSILPAFRDKLVFSTHTAYHVIDKKEVLYLEAKGNYSLIHLAGGKTITLSRNLKSILEKLHPSEFQRIHASYVMNLYRLTGIRKNGRLEILIDDQIQLPLSEGYKKNMIDLLKNLKI